MARLYKSVHQFTASHPSALSFKSDEVFVSVRGGAESSEADENWYFVLSVRGEPGYVPRSYVTNTQLGTGDTVERGKYIFQHSTLFFINNFQIANLFG